jgi:hypothetical protein
MRGKINPEPNAALVTFPSVGFVVLVFVVLVFVVLVIGGIITGGVTVVVLPLLLLLAFVPLSPGKPL